MLNLTGWAAGHEQECKTLVLQATTVATGMFGEIRVFAVTSRFDTPYFEIMSYEGGLDTLLTLQFQRSFMMSRNAEEMKKDVVDSLYWDTRVDASDVQVEISGADVKLTGTVPNYVAYWAAEDDARFTRGVVNVDNQIEVKLPAGLAVPSDKDITTYINNIFLANPVLDKARIEASVDAGVVTLTGAVDTYWQRVRAEQLASDVAGVIAVKNELSIVPTRDVLDEAIADDIRAALERNFLIDADAVTVKVKDGVVTLSGEVPNWYALRDAREIAYHTLGVVEVNDFMTIT